MAGKGRYFDRLRSGFASLSSAGGVDNCRVEIATASSSEDPDVEFLVPILDGSSREWIDSIEQTGTQYAIDQNGNTCEKMAPFLTQPTYVERNDSFLLAFPSPNIYITCKINFPEVLQIGGSQWFKSDVMDKSLYKAEIAYARTFCEEA